MKRTFALTSVLVICGPALGQNLATGLRLGAGTSDSCPVRVTGVRKGSPAEAAGIHVGDVLTVLDGRKLTRLNELPEVPDSKTEVVVQWMHENDIHTATLKREPYNKLLEPYHEKVLSSGMIAPMDATEAEMNEKMAEIRDERFADRAFPLHYPTNEKLYYPGFEVLILKNPPQVVVLGIEDGPASHAGVHWGDTILSVNGINPRNMSVSELEQIFSSEKPASMSLQIKRGDMTKTYTFELAQAAHVLRDNSHQFYRGHLVPLGIPEKYLPCFIAP